MSERYRTIEAIVAATAPSSVRHIYYAAIVRRLIGKDTKATKRSNYGKIQRAVLRMRRDGHIDYRDIVDNTRWMRKPRSWSDLDAALRDWQSEYRRDMWASEGVLLEVWCESESLAGVLNEITTEWDIPLLPIHGYTSESFAWGAVDSWLADDRPPVVLYVGDWDTHGRRMSATCAASSKASTAARSSGRASG